MYFGCPIGDGLLVTSDVYTTYACGFILLIEMFFWLSEKKKKKDKRKIKCEI